jgi:hypothetical protein
LQKTGRVGGLKIEKLFKLSDTPPADGQFDFLAPGCTEHEIASGHGGDLRDHLQIDQIFTMHPKEPVLSESFLKVLEPV